MDLTRTLPRLDVPLVMAQSRLDKVAPGEAAERFVRTVEAPRKQLVWFEESAHTPHFEEPDKFRHVIMRIRTKERRRHLALPPRQCGFRPSKPCRIR